MEESVLKKQSKYFFVACFITILIISFYVVRSFLITIISALLLTYIFYPIYKKILYIFRSKNVAAFVTTVMTVLITIIPLVFAANSLTNESVQVFYKVRSFDASKAEDIVREYFNGNINLGEYVIDLLNTLSLSIAKNMSDFVVALPKKMLDFFVMLFTMFYLFKEGPTIVDQIKEHIPLKDKHRMYIAKKFGGVVYAILYGLVLTAFIQGAVGALGLWIFGVDSPILWGLVMIILSILPFVGASLVWFPAAVYKIVLGETVNGVGLLLYGMLIISTIDNIVRPKIIGAKGKIHPVLVLVGVLGGFKVFGFLGAIIGPLVLAILTVFFDLYLLEKNEV